MALSGLIVAAGSATAHATTQMAAQAAQSASRTYDLDFTLPTAGKSGCLVCHGDKNLLRTDSPTATALYIDTRTVMRSVHVDTPCTGCHVDFAAKTPHRNAGNDEVWVATAKSMCKNCHQPAFSAYANGAHSPAGKPGESATETAAARRAAGKPVQVPMCGDCHAGHTIRYLDVSKYEKAKKPELVERAVAGRAALHNQGIEICGPCHEEATNSYNDYYHGAAYRRGAPDAPSCWDCHGWHDILPADDRRSTVNESRLTETCGQAGCHKKIGNDENFVEYAQLIHGRKDVRDNIPAYAVVDRIRATVRGIVTTVGSWFD